MKEKSSVKDWYRFAEMYANTAGFLLDNRKPPYDAVCYLSGLSAECAMKGFLLERNPGLPLPETHNLKELCQACAWFEDKFSSLLEDCQALCRFATPSGFPSFERASPEDAGHAMKIHANRTVPNPGADPRPRHDNVKTGRSDSPCSVG